LRATAGRCYGPGTWPSARRGRQDGEAPPPGSSRADAFLALAVLVAAAAGAGTGLARAVEAEWDSPYVSWIPTCNGMEQNIKCAIREWLQVAAWATWGRGVKPTRSSGSSLTAQRRMSRLVWITPANWLTLRLSEREPSLTSCRD